MNTLNLRARYLESYRIISILAHARRKHGGRFVPFLIFHSWEGRESDLPGD